VQENLSRVRADEMARAREILGVHQEWLGFVDSGLPEGDPLPPLPEGCFALQPVEQAAGRLVEVIRRFRPHVVTTYDESGGYPHPDHVMTHKVSVEAFDAAGDPERYLAAGEPWQPLKLYYHRTFTKARVVALHDAMLERGLDSPYAEWLEQWPDEHDMSTRVTTRVECADWFERRDAALLAHATQVDPNGRWFAIPLDLQRAVWPTEDYELARSLVDADPPEDDLFVGVRERTRA
jgi:mycothiol S-conjugate amidase